MWSSSARRGGGGRRRACVGERVACACAIARAGESESERERAPGVRMYFIVITMPKLIFQRPPTTARAAAPGRPRPRRARARGRRPRQQPRRASASAARLRRQRRRCVRRMANATLQQAPPSRCSNAIQRNLVRRATGATRTTSARAHATGSSRSAAPQPTSTTTPARAHPSLAVHRGLSRGELQRGSSKQCSPSDRRPPWLGALAPRVGRAAGRVRVSQGQTESLVSDVPAFCPYLPHQPSANRR